MIDKAAKVGLFIVSPIIMCPAQLSTQCIDNFNIRKSLRNAETMSLFLNLIVVLKYPYQYLIPIFFVTNC